MWKQRIPVSSVPTNEQVLETRDQTIREIVDELVRGAQELRDLLKESK